MLRRIISRLFGRKTVVQTLDLVAKDIRAGWSSDDPIKADAKGNVTHVCAGVAYDRAMQRGGNPKTWGLMENVMGGVFPLVNKEPGMTKEKILDFIAKGREIAVREQI